MVSGASRRLTAWQAGRCTRLCLSDWKPEFSWGLHTPRDNFSPWKGQLGSPGDCLQPSAKQQSGLV